MAYWGTPQRPARRHTTTTYEKYDNHGYHAQDGGTININTPPSRTSDNRPYHGFHKMKRSPPPDSDEESTPRKPTPKRRSGNRNPRRDEPESDEEHQFTPAVRQSANHPGVAVTPTVINNAATRSAPVLQSLNATVAGKPIPNSLHDNADEPIFSVCRNGKAEALYNIIQTEIRYNQDEAGVPYSILGFRLERGEDQKRCLEVRLTGSFTHNSRYKNVIVKHLHHVPSTERKLAELQFKETSGGQGQIQVGFNGKPVALVTIVGLKSTEFTVTKRQRIDARFNDSQAEGTFSLTLALDNGVEKGSDIPVAEEVFFWIVLRLEEDRQPMQLSLSADVRYASGSQWSWLGSRSKVVSTNPFINVYSGNAFHDIIKHVTLI